MDNNILKATENKFAPFGMGVKLLEGAEADQVDLGPLTELKGTWGGADFMGWNVIAVPARTATPTGGPGGFILEVIPYREVITFKPVVVAGNRGNFIGSTQSIQRITGLVYEQRITSVCDSERCHLMGFPPETEIHVETGLLLYMNDCTVAGKGEAPICNNPEFNIARLGTVPHGNAFLALGNSRTNVPRNNDFFGPAPIKARPVNAGDKFHLGYIDEYTGLGRQFPQFNQKDPNTFLFDTLTNNNQKISAMTTLNMSTKHQTGGILNIPFIEDKIKALDLDATFWIQHIEGSGTLQLQYSQTINLVFPGHGEYGIIPVIWPHVTVNTLKKLL